MQKFLKNCIGAVTDKGGPVQKFLKNCKGAVTVMVTMLMIPAILVSGTAVDVARIYMTRNSVQNANQMAANAALASYNAMLKDLYGLYGFMQDDPKLADMVNEYLEITIFGKDPNKGTFRAYLGSDELSADLQPSGSLRDTEVLKQQILEYMKFRGPAILLQRLFGELEGGGGQNLSHDNIILETKKGIDDDFQLIMNKYKSLYYDIMQGDSVRVSQGQRDYFTPYESVNDTLVKEIIPELGSIREDFEKLEDLRDEYGSEIRAQQREEIQGQYMQTMASIRQRAAQIESLIGAMKVHAEDFKRHYDTVIAKAEDLDRERASLLARVDELRGKLHRGECSQSVADALLNVSPSDPPGSKPLIDRYEELMKDDILSMAITYKAESIKYIDEVLLPALDDPLFIIYRDYLSDITDENSLTLEQLQALNSSDPDFRIDYGTNRAAFFAGLTALPADDPGCVDFLHLDHVLPEPFYRFGNIHFGEEQRDFWLRLEELALGGSKKFIDIDNFDPDNPQYSNGDKSTEDTTRGQSDKINADAGGSETNAPSGGAQSINDPDWRGTGDSFDFGSLVGNVVDVFKSPMKTLERAADYALILTYDMAMFSHYTTANTTHNLPPQRTITGVQMGGQVNYYYQSEWEYLLVGKQNASSNLNTITGILAGIRAVLNFVAMWGIRENNIVISMLYATGPWGFIPAEIYRWGMLAAETAYDVVRLRRGCSVAVFKDNNTWVCKPSTFYKLGQKCVCDKGANVFALSYEDYLTTFFIAKALATSDPSRVLVNRTADLIEWNVNNSQQGFNADVSKMNKFLNKNDGSYDPVAVFRMTKAATTFSITTTVDMRMLFLSMPLAQRGINGVVPPRTLAIAETDYRGY